MEIAFAFNNIERTEEYNGEIPEDYALAEKLGKTRVTFAHTGDQNNKSIPKREPFTNVGGATKLFNNQSEFVFSHEIKLIEKAKSIQQHSPY